MCLCVELWSALFDGRSNRRSNVRSNEYSITACMTVCSFSMLIKNHALLLKILLKYQISSFIIHSFDTVYEFNGLIQFVYFDESTNTFLLLLRGNRTKSEKNRVEHTMVCAAGLAYFSTTSKRTRTPVRTWRERSNVTIASVQ